MDWPITGTPTWAERQTYGPKLTPVQFAECVHAASTEPLAWRHIHFVATMMNENGLQAWARPLVWKPGNEAHLSVDRGVCALNSRWWAHVRDFDAYEPAAAVGVAIGFCEEEAAKGTRGAKLWDWGPILDWQWHGYALDLDVNSDPAAVERYRAFLPEARAAVNAVRAANNLTAL